MKFSAMEMLSARAGKVVHREGAADFLGESVQG
jgi:hypothetical protein